MLETDMELGVSYGNSRGLIVEWDYLALEGLDICVSAARERLARSGVDLAPAMFVRYCLGREWESGLSRLLDAARKEALVKPLAAEIRAAVVAAVESAMDRPRQAVIDILRDMAARGVKVGVLTQLPEEAAKAALGRLELADGFVLLPVAVGQAGSFGAEAWRRAWPQLHLAEGLGVALTASGSSTKAALKAGLNVVAVPQPLTEHEDYGGADLVAEPLNGKAAVAEILSLLRMNA